MMLSTPTLQTDRLLLRPFVDLDAEALYSMHSNPHVPCYWDAPPWTERDRPQTFIDKCRRLAMDGTGVRLAVERMNDGAFIGWCSPTRFDRDHRATRRAITEHSP